MNMNIYRTKERSAKILILDLSKRSALYRGAGENLSFGFFELFNESKIADRPILDQIKVLQCILAYNYIILPLTSILASRRLIFSSNLRVQKYVDCAYMQCFDKNLLWAKIVHTCDLSFALLIRFVTQATSEARLENLFE